MIELKHTGCESWFNPDYAKKLSAQLGDDLWKRCEGRRGLFVTLTYDRSKYRDALDLYRRQADEQHVPLFLRKVSRRLGVSLKGRWFSKLEFQQGGWVHWHLIILDVEKIPHDVATELWGHGHVWLKRLNRRNVRYCTKYVVKAGACPAWLYNEAPRSVKIVRVSPGFWGRDDASEPAAVVEPEDAAGSMRFPGIYEPIGTRIESRRHAFVARDSEGHYRRAAVDLGPLLLALMRRGCMIVGRRGRWLQIDASIEELDRAMDDCGRRGATREAGAPRPLHLIGTGIPDDPPLPRWLDRWFEEQAAQEAVA